MSQKTGRGEGGERKEKHMRKKRKLVETSKEGEEEETSGKKQGEQKRKEKKTKELKFKKENFSKRFKVIKRIAVS